jgi:hypothetical protein
VRKLLNVPDGTWIYAAVILGQAAESKPASGPNAGRKAIEDLVIHNHFD